SPDKVQIAGFYYQSSTRSGSDTIVGTVTCPDFPGVTYIGQPAQVCRHAIDASVTKAEQLEATGQTVEADRLWAQIDAAIVRATPAVAAFNPTDVTFVSKRVGNYQHNPQYQILLDQLWVQ